MNGLIQKQCAEGVILCNKKPDECCLQCFFSDNQRFFNRFHSDKENNTLMCYIIGGSGSKTMSKAKSWLMDYPQESYELLKLLVNTVVDYLEMQIRADAQLLQVFESSAEDLSKTQFLSVSVAYLKEIRERLVSKSIPLVPMTIFAKEYSHSLTEQASDRWTVDPIEARKQVGPKITLQENLDPQDLYKTPEKVRTLSTEMVHKYTLNCKSRPRHHSEDPNRDC